MSDINLLQIKTNRENSNPSSNSSYPICSDAIIFSNNNNSSYTIKHISNYEDFIFNFANIKNPCYTTDDKFLKINLSEKLNDKNIFDKTIEYSVPVETIEKSKIISLDNPKQFYIEIKSSLFYKFIFSNPENIEEEKENEIFNRIHTYCNSYYKRCNINQFCPDTNFHFPKNNDKIFYKINRYYFYVESIKVFHHNNFGVGHFYAPKGSGKSILFRSILFNFAYFKDVKRLTPFMFFNIKLLDDLLKNAKLKELKKIILHESYSLYKEIKSSKEFLNKINFNIKDTFELIENIIISVVNEVKSKKLFFVLDGYSFKYDENNKLNNIIKLVYEKKSFFVEIIYDIIDHRDSENLYRNLDPKNYINYDTEFVERYFYFEELKKISEIKENLEVNDIPGNYNEIFGENVSYYFEFKKSGLNFNDFIKIKKLEIKNDILYFYNLIPKDEFRALNLIVGKNIKIKYGEILKYTPANYIKIIIEPKPVAKYFGTDYNDYDSNKTYSFEYSFPLVKTVIEEILSSERCINMKHKDFLNLSPQALGLNFDKEMLDIFLDLIKKNSIFNHTKTTYLYVDNILEKHEKNNSNQIYKRTDVINKINKIMDVQEFKNTYKDVKFNDFTFIGVFQNISQGKAFDVLFFIKENTDDTHFSMNLLQIKCSDTYVEDKSQINEQAAYVKEKFEYLLDISVKTMYLSYLSIFQKPKKFAKLNKSRTFLYDIMNDKFVDFEQKEYKIFPILKDAIVYYPEEKLILESIKNDLKNSFQNEILLIEKYDNITKFKNKTNEEINALLNNQVYISGSKNEYKYFYKYDNSFGYSYKNGIKFLEKDFNRIFDIKIKSN